MLGFRVKGLGFGAHGGPPEIRRPQRVKGPYATGEGFRV